MPLQLESREEVEVRNESDNAAYTAEKTLRDLGDKAPADLKSDAEARIADVRAALATDDVERIKSARDALQAAMFKVSESIYSAAGAGATAGGETDSTGPQGDDAVEADFKEE